MKVAFVIPKDDDQHGPQNQYTQGRIFPPAGLARMAGIVGKQARVALIDERMESSHTKQKVQIAIVFINSYNQQRSYELARYYHAMGSIVVMTGPMLSDSIDKAHDYADCLFVGAGEDNLPDFLSDYRKGKTKRYYRSTGIECNSGQNSLINENTGLRLAS